MGSMTMTIVPLLAAFTQVVASPVPSKLTPEAAVAFALRNNLSLKIDRLAPELSSAAVKSARAVFDPVAFGEVVTGGDASVGGSSSEQAFQSTSSALDFTAKVGVRKKYKTGTTVETSVSGGVARDLQMRSDPESEDQPSSKAALGAQAAVTVRQAILRGRGSKSDKAKLTAAKAERRGARKNLRRKAELLAAETLKAFWELYAAQANVETQRVGLQQSQSLLRETQALIEAGKQPAVEKVAAKYSVQVGRRALLQAKAKVGNARDRLARLMGISRGATQKVPAFSLVASPVDQKPRVDLQELERVALLRRGDHLAKQEDVQGRRAMASAADHELLPRLDLAATVGVGRARSGAGRLSGFGVATPGATGFNWSVGLVLEIPLNNDSAKAQKLRAHLELRRAETSVEDSKQAIAQEIKISWREVKTAWESLKLTRSAVRLAEMKFQNERERYRAGKSSAQMLTLVQAELLKEKMALEDAKAKYNETLVELRAASGTLVQEMS